MTENPKDHKYCKRQELRQTLIPDHSGYVGAPSQTSSPSAQGIPQSKNPHRTAGALPAKAQLLNSKASYQQGATAPAATSASNKSALSGQHPPHTPTAPPLYSDDHKQPRHTDKRHRAESQPLIFRRVESHR
ncbi:hypothetical protein CRG98_033747 [Punica granatum]|uniref:Uncharacterized protein n=1 Tax=Punica granatum TaxID=22663 RepID=A0A2I0IPE7_PUNGR|nr:hypothetical protein CRG98_033747 [Punica granatum]